MSGSLNRVDLIGHLGRDPEIRVTQDGGKIVQLSIATTESWKDRNTGERRERVEWNRCVIFNEALAKVAEQYLRKGSHVYLSGQLQTRKWTDQSGTEKYTTEIVLQRYRGELTMLGGRGDGEARGGDQGGSAGDYRSATSGGGGYGNAPDDLDSVPF